MATGERQDRVHALDLLRLVAALGVVAFHLNYVAPADVRGAWWYPTAFAKNGDLGVHAFFMISGFVILMSAGRDGMTWQRFLSARAVRLYPAFWICCLVSIAALYGAHAWSAGDIALNLTMFPKALSPSTPWVEGVYWTLALEAKFYALIAVLLAMRSLHRLELVLWAWLLVAELSAPRSPFWDAAMAEYASHFVFGCACYLLRSRKDWRVIALALTSGAAALPVDPQRAVIVLACAALVAAIALGVIRLPAWRWLATAGAMSYPLYLIHQRIGERIVDSLTDVMPGSAAYAVAVAWALLTAWYVAARLETPARSALRWAARTLAQRLKQRPAPAAVLNGSAERPGVCDH